MALVSVFTLTIHYKVANVARIMMMWFSILSNNHIWESMTVENDY